jgi:hypothetical protein
VIWTGYAIGEAGVHNVWGQHSWNIRRGVILDRFDMGRYFGIAAPEP